MNFQQIKNLKGFMPDHEGMALFEWAKKFSALGPILEIGTCLLYTSPSPRD